LEPELLENSPKKLGEWIKYHREFRKLTQFQLAQKVDINLGTLKDIERNEFIPSHEDLRKVIHALGLEPAVLPPEIDIDIEYNSINNSSAIDKNNR